MKYLNLIIFFLIFFSTEEAQAQMTNTGELTVLPNTIVSVLSDFENSTTGNVVQNGEIYFHKNYTNNGNFSYDANFNTGTARFIGSLQQQISSANMSIFYNALFNNPTPNYAFLFSGELYIANQANLTAGVIENRTSSNRFIFGPEAGHSNTSNNSFVDGAVEKLGNLSFDFPIGGIQYYRRLSISNPDFDTDLFSSEYFPQNSNTQYPHANKETIIKFIDYKEYWKLTRKTGTSQVFVTLTWNENTTSPEILSEPLDEIHIVRWDETKNLWVDEGGVVNSITKEVTTISTVVDYGIFALARVQNPPNNCLEVYNLMTPNGDGVNDIFKIACIENYPNNSIEIFNRWGNTVFKTNGYNNKENAFKGYSDGRATVNRSKLLPSGTYFYILRYTDDNSRKNSKSGFLYIH